MCGVYREHWTFAHGEKMLKVEVHSKTANAVIIHPLVVPNSNYFLSWNTKRDMSRGLMLGADSLSNHFHCIFFSYSESEAVIVPNMF